MRPIIWASIFKTSMLLVANAAYEVCSTLYRGLRNGYVFDLRE